MGADDQRPPLRVGILGYGLDRPAAGIGRYTVELVAALQAHHSDVEVVLLKPFGHPAVGVAGVDAIRLRGTRLLPAMMTLGPLEIAYAARRFRLDVVHDPCGIAPFLPYVAGRFGRVVTIHDMVPFIYPETHARATNLLFRQYIPHTLRFADRVITVSESSRRDIERFYPQAIGRVQSIHCGVGRQFRPQAAERASQVLLRLGISPPYILVVGVLAPRKNLGTAFRAFDRAKALGLPHRLVVVGRKAWKTEKVFSSLASIDYVDDVIFTDYVDDADLPSLYAGAESFLFPSIYEGFGLPPIEAMACGTPVIASNASSLPEVVGTAGLLVDPYDVEGFASAIYRVATEPGLADDLRVRGLERARQFSWERAAEAHAAAYRGARAHAARSRRER